MNEQVTRVTLSRELSSEEIMQIETAFKEQFSNCDSVTATASKSMGLTGAELVLTVAVSYATSIAATATYDFGKFLIEQLRSKGVDSEETDEE